MPTVVVRVWMPDRPGALGQVASRIGAVRGDVLAIEILERGGGRAVDELTVTIPDHDVLKLLANEIDAVDGVSVEELRIVDAARTDPNLDALEVGVHLARASAGERPTILCTGIRHGLDADWVALVDVGGVVASVGQHPDTAWLRAFHAGSGHLDGVDGASPGDLAWARLDRRGATVTAGRASRPIHERERLRLALLARLADALA